jgi:hypothetical protein
VRAVRGEVVGRRAQAGAATACSERLRPEAEAREGEHLVVTRSPIEKLSESSEAPWQHRKGVGGGEEHAGGLTSLADGTVAGSQG